MAFVHTLAPRIRDSQTSVPLRVDRTDSLRDNFFRLRKYRPVFNKAPRRLQQGRLVCSSSLSTRAPSQSGELFTYTSLGFNGYALRYRSCTVVVDPWLYDDLIFLQPFLYRQQKERVTEANMDVTDFPVEKIDTLVLTQSIEDHAHPATLERLPRDLRVYATPKCRGILKKLEFSNVTYFDYDMTYELGEGLQLKALKGASLVLYREYALLFKVADGAGRTCTLYHEPHGDHLWGQLKGLKDSIDIVMSPFANASVGIRNAGLLEFFLFKGYKGNVDVCSFIKPKACIGYDNSKAEKPTGLFSYFLHVTGLDTDELKRRLRACEGLENMHILDSCKPMEEVVVWDFAAHCVDDSIGKPLGKVFDTNI